MRFFANAHPRVDQRVHQVLTAMLLVSAERGVTLAPASAASLHVDGVVFKELAHHGGDTRVDADPDRPGRAARHLVARGGHPRRTTCAGRRHGHPGVSARVMNQGHEGAQRTPA